MTDIAAALGVTPTTVSNAFNRPDQLSPALRERVLAAAGQMGYRGPDPAARSMRRGRLRAIGVLYTDRLSYAFADPAFVLFLQGVSQAAEELGLGITLIPGAPTAARDPVAVAGAVVDGFIVYSMADGDPLVEAAVARRLPTVTADSPRIAGVAYAGINDEDAARNAAEHLVALGHSRFGIVSGELLLDYASGPASTERQETATFGVNRSRLRGYAAAITVAGIDWAAVQVEECPAGLEEEARAATRRMLAGDQRPTAILAMSDRLARGAVAGVHDLAFRVPDDVSVVGFDDDPEAARTIPPLTTVRQPHVRKGETTARLLIDQLEGRVPEQPEVLPTELIVRASTGPPPVEPSAGRSIQR
jgi:DNA-binding LacI/PurR family transcriptional regulator